MSVNAEVTADEERTPGFLYVTPREGFDCEEPRLGAIYTWHWVSPEPVKPLACFAIAPEAFPLPIARYRSGDSFYRAMLRMRGAVRRARR